MSLGNVVGRCLCVCKRIKCWLGVPSLGFPAPLFSLPSRCVALPVSAPLSALFRGVFCAFFCFSFSCSSLLPWLAVLLCRCFVWCSVVPVVPCLVLLCWGLGLGCCFVSVTFLFCGACLCGSRGGGRFVCLCLVRGLSRSFFAVRPLGVCYVLLFFCFFFARSRCCVSCFSCCCSCCWCCFPFWVGCSGCCFFSSGCCGFCASFFLVCLCRGGFCGSWC